MQMTLQNQFGSHKTGARLEANKYWNLHDFGWGFSPPKSSAELIERLLFPRQNICRNVSHTDTYEQPSEDNVGENFVYDPLESHVLIRLITLLLVLEMSDQVHHNQHSCKRHQITRRSHMCGAHQPQPVSFHVMEKRST